MHRTPAWIGEDRAGAQRARAEFHPPRIDGADLASCEARCGAVDGRLTGADDFRLGHQTTIDGAVVVAAPMKLFEPEPAIKPSREARAVEEKTQGGAKWQRLIA